MALNKILESELVGKDIAGLVDRPSEAGISASVLKAYFDKIEKEVIIPKFNALIDALQAQTGASEIGVTPTVKFAFTDLYDALVGAYDYTDYQITQAVLPTFLPKAENISVADTGGHFTGVDVEAVLLELFTKIGTDLGALTTAYAGGGLSNYLSSLITASKVMVSDGTGKLTASALNSTQLAYLANISSDIQAQVTDAQNEIVEIKSGWNALPAVAYVSAGSPTFAMNITGDYTGILTAGMRIKLTQDATTKYFIILLVGAYTGGFTQVLLYGGTDYTLNANAITAPSYSGLKAPFGFPLNPTKWSITLLDVNTALTTNTPSANTWYNQGNFTLPIGSWNMVFRGNLSGNGRTTVGYTTLYATLGTVINSAGEIDLTVGLFIYIPYTTSQGNGIPFHATKNLTVTSATVYYLNIRTTDAGLGSIALRGDITPTLVRAICAYL